MNRSGSLLTLSLVYVFSSLLLHADTAINIPALALGNGQAGSNGAPFVFTLESDQTVAVKALFMTHWLTPQTSNVVANPKAVRFVLDGRSYPLITGNEDFYGYMNGTLWPERTVRKDQLISIEESITLTKGPHSIQFMNGLMERDDSRFKVVYSTADWATASIVTSSVGNPKKSPPNAIVLPILPIQPKISLAPEIQTITEGLKAVFTLSSSDASRTEFNGNDGTALSNPSVNVLVQPVAGSYNYQFLAQGKDLIRWNVVGADKIWIDTPAGKSVDVTNELNYTAVESGDYMLRAVAGTETTSTPFHVDLPTASATATLTVTKAPAVGGGPEVTAFSPIEANYTVTSGPAAGHSYGRSWQSDGAWAAYLGRDGVAFRVTGSSSAGAVANFEIQAKAPVGDWFTLTSGSPAADTPNGPGISVAQTMSTRLGTVRPDKPLLPSDPSLVGQWRLRARVSDTTGAWSPWAFEQPLNVVYPVKDVTLIGRTLPPVDDAAWFTASPEKQYTTQVLVP